MVLGREGAVRNGGEELRMGSEERRVCSEEW